MLNVAHLKHMKQPNTYENRAVIPEIINQLRRKVSDFEFADSLVASIFVSLATNVKLTSRITGF